MDGDRGAIYAPPAFGLQALRSTGGDLSGTKMFGAVSADLEYSVGVIPSGALRFLVAAQATAAISGTPCNCTDTPLASYDRGYTSLGLSLGLLYRPSR